jgi:hypothetical protein
MPLGTTCVIRGDIRNADIIAEQTVSLLMLPKEVYIRYWYAPYSPGELKTCLLNCVFIGQIWSWFSESPEMSGGRKGLEHSRKLPGNKIGQYQNLNITIPPDAPVRSRFTCQRIKGSESRSQSITGLVTCLGELVVICWVLL